MVAHVSINGRALQLRTLVLYITDDSGVSLEAAGNLWNPRGVRLELHGAKTSSNV